MSLYRFNWSKVLCFVALFFLAIIARAEGKLIGTSAVSQVEGSAGGGLVPWAVTAGNGSRDEIGAAFHSGLLELDEFSMTTTGAAVGLYDRFELSVARLSFNVENQGDTTYLNSYGAKARLAGDLIFSELPLFSLGVQYKQADFSDQSALPSSVEDDGIDVYLSTTKLWLDGLFHRNTLLNLTLRWTEANQLGFVGFGGDDGASLQMEASAAVFLNRHWVVGTEYRQKPDNIEAVTEDDWKNVFVAYVPTDQLTLMAAFLDAGDIGGVENQAGAYFLVKGAF